MDTAAATVIRYRQDIDGLRAVAVVSVLLYHLFPGVAPGGFVGVDIFFVISGYLISQLIFKALDSARFSFREFYMRRARRIFPGLLLIMAFTSVLGWMILFPAEYRALGRHVLGGATFTSNFVLWSEAGYFDTASELKPLLHLWSLGIEEQFYLIWPALLYLAWRCRFNIPVFLIACFSLSFLLNAVLLPSTRTTAFYWPFSRFWELVIGAGLAYLHFQPDRFRGRRVDATALAGAGAILASILLLNGSTPFPGWWALLPTVGAAMVILAGPGACLNRRLLSLGPMVWIGAISYPLYLWHWPLLSLARSAFEESPSIALRLAILLACFVLAAATTRWIERPIRYGEFGAIKAGALCAGLALSGVFGYLATEKAGFAGDHLEIEEGMERQTDQWMFPAESACPQEYHLARGTECAGIRSDRPAAMAMIGDSHARASYPGFADSFDRRGQTLLLLTHQGCLPFWNVDTYVPGEEQGLCNQFANGVIDFLAARTEIRKVLVISRGPMYISGAGFGLVDKHNVVIRLPNDVTDGGIVFRTGLESTVDRLLQAGKDVYVFVDIPELGFDPRPCWLPPRPLFFRRSTRCAVNRADYEMRNREYRAIVGGVAGKYRDLHVFDAARYFCDGKGCSALHEGRLVYRDDDHVNLDGGRYLASKFIAEFP